MVDIVLCCRLLAQLINLALKEFDIVLQVLLVFSCHDPLNFFDVSMLAVIDHLKLTPPAKRLFSFVKIAGVQDSLLFLRFCLSIFDLSNHLVDICVHVDCFSGN